MPASGTPRRSRARDARSRITIEIARRTGGRVPRRRLRDAVAEVLGSAPVRRAHISLAVVDDAEMRRLHGKFLHGDETTDVLSFVYSPPPDLEGEIVICLPQARRMARHFGGGVTRELLLYALHGALHLLGYDDQQHAARQRMRRAEQDWFQRWGWPPARGLHDSA